MTRAELILQRKKIESEQARKRVMGSNYTPSSGFTEGVDLVQLLLVNIQSFDNLETESSFSSSFNCDTDSSSSCSSD